MDKISVIVPVYNVEKYLEKCVKSIQNQTYKNLEIILVDDGSPDNCGKMCDEFAKEDSRVKVIHKENGGLSDARNAGLSIATGEYITFVDSDDTIDIKECKVLYDLIKKYNTQIAFCELQRVYVDPARKPSVDNSTKKNILTKEITVEEAVEKILLDDNIGNYVCNKLMKKELLMGIKFPVGKTFEDMAVMYQIVSQVDRIAYTNEALYYYLVGRIGAITTKYSKEKVFDMIEHSYKAYQFLSQKYPNIKACIDVFFVRYYTSTMEKICINDYEELFEKKEIVDWYNLFKDCIDSLNDDTLSYYLEPYRLVSSVLLRRGRNLYKKYIRVLYENIKNKEIKKS